MAQVRISEDIRPISDLKAKGSEIISQATTTKRPVVLTRHGRGVAVVLAVEDYERLQHDAEHGALMRALREGERDIAAGDILSQDEMRSRWLADGPSDDR